MSTKQIRPSFPFGIFTKEQSQVAGLLNTGLIEHSVDAVFTVPANEIDEVIETAIRFNPRRGEFEGGYPDGWRALGSSAGGGVKWVRMPYTPTIDKVDEGTGYLIDNRTGQTLVKLPVTPVESTTISFCDLFGTFSDYPLTIDAGSQKIYGELGAMSFSTDHMAFSLTYSGEEYGWVITAGVGLGQGRVYNRLVLETVVPSPTKELVVQTEIEFADVYKNGIRVSDNAYKIVGNKIVFNDTLLKDDKMMVIEYIPIQMTMYDVNDKISGIQENVDKIQKEVDGVKETINTDLGQFQETVNQQIKEINDNLGVYHKSLLPVGVVIFLKNKLDPNLQYGGTKWAKLDQSKYIRIAATDLSNVGTVGGNNTFTISKANLPNVALSVSGSTSSFDYGTKTTNSTGAQTATSSTNGNHSHTISAWSRKMQIDSSGSESMMSGQSTISTSAAGNHNHTMSIGNHAHTVGIGAHVHTVSGSTEAMGSGNSITITPEFIVLAAWVRTE